MAVHPKEILAETDAPMRHLPKELEGIYQKSKIRGEPMDDERRSVEAIMKSIYGSLAKEPNQTINDIVKDTGICWEVVERYLLILQAVQVVRAKVRYSLRTDALTALQGSGRERMLSEFANFSEDKEKFLKQIEAVAKKEKED